MCGCNSSKKPLASQPSSLLSSSGNFTKDSIASVVEEGNKEAMVLIEYVGPISEPFTINSRVSRDIRYRFANNDQHRQKAVFLQDAQFLIGLTDREGESTYKILSTVGVENANDPTLFLGHPITA